MAGDSTTDVGGVASWAASRAGIAPDGSFGGSGKSISPAHPTGGHPTSSGQHGMATYGSNDYTRFSLDAGGVGGVFGVAILVAQLAITLEQYNLANKYWETNRVDFEFEANNYQPFLNTHKNEAFANPMFYGISGSGGNPQSYLADYVPMVGASLGRVKIYDEKWFQTRRRLHRYSVGLGRMADYNFYMNRKRAAGSAFIGGRRFEDARKDWKDEQFQGHRVQAVNFGITAGNVAKQGLASATGQLMHAYDEAGSRIGGFSNGISRRDAYNAARTAGSQFLGSGANMGYEMASSGEQK